MSEPRRSSSDRVVSWSHVGTLEVQWSRPKAPWVFRVKDSNGTCAIAMLKDEQVEQLRAHLDRAGRKG